MSREQLKVLVAVHATREDEGEQSVNRKLIELALLMTRLEKGSLMLLQAWTAFGEEVLRTHCTPEELRAYVDAAESAARSDLTFLATSFGDRLAGGEVVLRKGHPEDVIPQFAVSEGIDLAVMGTVARTGIAGLVIGNTAERMLQRLLCSVLAVKPDGFISPVRLDTPL
jgi:nucleotide-binding universal stress UspA family protein